MDSAALKDRTKRFALNALALIEELPKSNSGSIIGNQLGRYATLIGANYRSACRGKSKPDFMAKIAIVEEEADESCYWLELIIESDLIKNSKPEKLLKEARELTAIFTATGKTSKAQHTKFKD